VKSTSPPRVIARIFEGHSHANSIAEISVLGIRDTRRSAMKVSAPRSRAVPRSISSPAFVGGLSPRKAYGMRPAKLTPRHLSDFSFVR
jgi:hypothetical protein